MQCTIWKHCRVKYDLADGVGDQRLECAWGQLRQETRTSLRINAVCNRQLATYRHYVVKIGRSRSRLCFLRNPFGQMNTICTSLTLTECLRCYQHIPSLLVLSQKWSKSFTKQSLRQMSTTCNLIERLRWHLCHSWHCMKRGLLGKIGDQIAGFLIDRTLMWPFPSGLRSSRKR